MTKLTIDLDEEVARRLADAAADNGVAPERLAADTLTQRFLEPGRLGFVSLGRSGRGDLAEHHKDLRRQLIAEQRAKEA